MKKINFARQLFILGSIPVVDEKGLHQFLHREFPQHLHAMSTGNSIKNESICLRIFEKGEVELDESDLEFLKRNIESCRTAPDYMSSLALKAITEALDVKPKK